MSRMSINFLFRAFKTKEGNKYFQEGDKRVVLIVNSKCSGEILIDKCYQMSNDFQKKVYTIIKPHDYQLLCFVWYPSPLSPFFLTFLGRILTDLTAKCAMEVRMQVNQRDQNNISLPLFIAVVHVMKIYDRCQVHVIYFISFHFKVFRQSQPPTMSQPIKCAGIVADWIYCRVLIYMQFSILCKAHMYNIHM